MPQPTAMPQITNAPQPRATPTPIAEIAQMLEKQVNALTINKIMQAWPSEQGYNPVNIAFRESSLDPKEEGGLDERGLFQILPKTFHEEKAKYPEKFPDVTWNQMFEADPNIKMAKWLYDKYGWEPWSTAGPLDLKKKK